MPYEKPPLTYQEQINKLKSRGLHFENEDRAHHLLQHLSYYRFSAYLYPLIEEPKKTINLRKEQVLARLLNYIILIAT